MALSFEAVDTGQGLNGQLLMLGKLLNFSVLQFPVRNTP